MPCACAPALDAQRSILTRQSSKHLSHPHPPRPPLSPRPRRDLASGNFLRTLLPSLLQKGIVDMERHAVLADTEASQLETAVLTTELMSLAIALGVCGSASEFWQVHKGRDELVAALYDHAAEEERIAAARAFEAEQARARAIEAAAAESTAGASSSSGESTARSARDSQPDSGATAMDDSSVPLRAHIEMRRRSLVAAPAVFGNKEYAGDTFSTRGEYVEGMIYASRQQAPMDNETRAKMAKEMEVQSAITQLARTQARRSSIVQAQLKELSESQSRQPFPHALASF
jgi:hypothetical protein